MPLDVAAYTLKTRFIDAFLSAVLSGLTLHLLFNKLENSHLSTLKRLLAFLPLLPSWLFLPHFVHSWVSAIAAGYSTSYLTLICSVILYRLSPLHPLWKYPGPLLAKCTKFWGVYQSSTGKVHVNFLKLHRRYGPIVRTGPNELSFCDVDAIQPVLGPGGMGKGPIWDGRRSPKSKYFALIGIRDTATHLRRRKPWNQALNISSVRDYEPILRKRLDQLCEHLSVKGKEEVDLAEWMSFFTYDFMGDMAFGGGFELMRDGDVDGLWKLMEGGVRVQAYTQHIPWASPILYGLPGMGNAAQKLITFVITMSKKRSKKGMAETGQDLSSYLLDEGSPNPQPLNFGEYSSDAFLAIVAGSDTAATVLSSTFFYLLQDKSYFDRLRREIDENFPPNGSTVPADDSSRLVNMKLLNAVINEALRLQPPVPTGLQRAPALGSGGKVINSVFVPENTGVYVPPYAMQRDELYFSPDPERFWPERWITEDPTVVTNQAAFIPYSVGPMNCAGKQLAQLELRLVVATLVQRFDMELRPEWNTDQWEKNLEDYFVFKKGPLPVLLKARSK